GGAPTGALIVASPIASVACMIAPSKVCPSPNPDGAQAELLKNSRRKVVISVLLNVPAIVSVIPSEEKAALQLSTNGGNTVRGNFMGFDPTRELDRFNNCRGIGARGRIRCVIVATLVSPSPTSLPLASYAPGEAD